jgi:addiction module RelB/DinJ family antitoxin
MCATVQVRVDEETTLQAEQLFDRMGLDIPTAIRMFFVKRHLK